MRMDFGAVIDLVILVLNWLGAVAGLGTLGYAIANMLIAQRRPTGLQIGAAERILRTPYLVVASVVFFVLVTIFWKPLPLQLTRTESLVSTIMGTIILLPGLALYVWGLRTLGMSFNASSGFGVRLQQGHKLVTSGPFAYLRHPMYVGVILACWGSLLLFHTWSMLVWAVIMFGLIYRGQKEEQALAQAFGSQWEAYHQAVPGWHPRFKRWNGEDNS